MYMCVCECVDGWVYVWLTLCVLSVRVMGSLLNLGTYLWNFVEHVTFALAWAYANLWSWRATMNCSVDRPGVDCCVSNWPTGSSRCTAAEWEAVVWRRTCRSDWTSATWLSTSRGWTHRSCSCSTCCCSNSFHLWPTCSTESTQLCWSHLRTKTTRSCWTWPRCSMWARHR